MTKEEFAKKWGDKLGKLKALFASMTAEFEDFATKQGVTLIIDGPPDTGKIAKVKNEAGEEVPAPDGEYELESGTEIIVISGGEGKINEVRKPDSGVEEAERIEAASETPETFDEVLDAMYEMLWKLADQYRSMATMAGAALSLANENKGEVVLLSEKVEKWGKTPTKTVKATVVPAGRKAEFDEDERSLANTLYLRHKDRQKNQ